MSAPRAAVPIRPDRSRGGRSPSFLNRESLDKFCERGVLGTILAMLVFAPLAMGAVHRSQFVVLLGLALLLSAFWLVRIWVRQQYRFLLAPFAWAVLAFTGYAIWRYTQADIEFVARSELLQILLYALVFFAVLDNLSRQESVQFLLFALIILGTLDAFYGIYQYCSDTRHVLWYIRPDMYRGRGSGTYVNPNHFAGFLEMLLPIALAYIITARHKPVTKVFLGYSALMMIAGIGVSVSRGGFLAAGISLFVFFAVLLFNRDFRIPSAGILILLLVAGSLSGMRSWQAKKRFAQLEQNENIRLQYWRPAVELWKREPWLGVGAGHYDWRFQPWRYWQLQGRPTYVHNDYLQTVTEYGALGGAIIAAGLLALGWGVWKTWKFVRRTNEIITKPSNRSAVVLGCSVGLLAVLVHSAADFNMHIPGNALIAVTLMAILTSHLRFATERFWINPGVVGRLAGTLLLAALMGYFAWQLSRLGPQSYFLRRFYGKPATFEGGIATLKRAFQAEPQDADTPYEIGERLRIKAFDAGDNWEQLTREAISWLERAAQLNRWNSFIYVSLGQCYDWLKEPNKAADYFDKALSLDPKQHYVLYWYGWHRFQVGDLEGAYKYFKESYVFYRDNSPDALKYMKIIETRLAEEGKKL